MEQYGWAIAVGIILIAVSLSKAVPAVVRAFTDQVAARNAALAAGRAPAPSTAALDELQRRVAELGERVDFAERLLAKQREGERLAKPSS